MMNDKFQQAVALHRTGQLSRAQVMYEEVLLGEPRHFGALHLSGVLAGQSKDLPKALELIGRALDVEPANAAAHLNRAFALKQLGRSGEALAAYDRALSLKADSLEGQYKRGELLRELGRLEEALAGYDAALAIDPAFFAGHMSRGIVLEALGRWQEALAGYDRAAAIRADSAAAHVGRGNALKALGRFEEALASHDRALAIDPGCHEALLGRGLVLESLARWEAALGSYERALEIKPHFAATYVNRGAVLEALKQWQRALESYDRAIALEADNAGAHSNRGIVLAELGHLDAALASYDRAIALEPNFAEAYSNRGNLLTNLGQLDAAVASYDRAIAIKPDFAQAYENKAYALLLAGDFENGWICHEWRWERYFASKEAERDKHARDLWLGREPLAGKTILLYSEQGLGDTIQFCRYVDAVAKLGATVILEVREPLVSLMSRLPGVSAVVRRDSPVPRFDFKCSLLSLPLAFKTTLSTIPGHVPYLSSDPEKLRLWGERLGERRALRVGLVWSGGERPKGSRLPSINERRNIPLAKFAALAHPAIQFYSLQKGQPAESELSELKGGGWDGPELIDFTSSLEDFSDTAALVENLDLVISVDTSTAHLAGALGKPVWLLNRFDTCWRWMLNRTDSPWYPTLKLYRQDTAGNWDDVVRRVKTDLLRWVASGEHSPGSRLSG
jgi:tetratricopeptide (TPR) repeat protein